MKKRVISMLMLAIVLCGCANSEEDRSHISDSNVIEESEVAEQNTDKTNSNKEENVNPISDSSEEKDEQQEFDVESYVESIFEKNGIINYKQIDLKQIAQSEGVSLDQFCEYQFFYENDGLQIEGYLSFPKDKIQRDAKSPCIIYNHGGNRQFGALSEMDTISAAFVFDSICIASNYRGCGKSEGEDQFGGDDVKDIIKLMDLCENFDFIDANELNMMGISRGGMMTYEVLREDHRIKNAVVISGVADCFMMYDDRADMHDVMEELIGGTPQELAEEYEKRSATYWAEEIDTPLYIIHSKTDDRVAFGEVEALVKKLEASGKNYKFIANESGEHGVLNQADVAEISKWMNTDH